ncbi:TetR/AcrR family transcriptional regulator [Kurthia huakuii]|uniref:TetR/AcrR family transcriptional regulator n=1 Tax=Kurthia huakuii TaxID=1421019 RepID=UPI000495E787|nr:TetR/AcrR family transcriptional regulator [Kurthia huakuii]MBM7699799.1 TetR/AcrR family transcriptional repressor of lmrAB and yxaGH operons [Kurthia huakuii]
MKNNTTRDHLLEVATKLFHSQGYHATGLNQILKESGTPKGSLYHYFPDGKDQLVKEVVQSSSNRLVEDIKAYLDSHPNPVVAIQNYLDKMSERFEQLDTPDALDMPPFSLISLESAFANEEIRLVCQENYEQVEQLYYHKIVNSGIAQLQAHALAVSICAAIEGVLMLSITKKSNEPINMLRKTIPGFFA